ncbi:MAG: S9 family peptidase [Dehalococcoidia bacterium]
MAQPLSPETLVYGFTMAADPQVSPDGGRIVYSLASVDGETKQGRSDIWLCGIDGANARQLTHGGRQNGGARWSPNGTQVAFVSDRVETSGLFVLPMEGGEARELTRHPNRIIDPAWSPDGTQIAYAVEVDPQAPGAREPNPDEPPPVRVTSRIDYKQDGRGYLGDKRYQVFVVDVATGERRQLTQDPVDHAFPAWAPDSQWLAVQVLTDNGMHSKLGLVPVTGGVARTIELSPEGTISTWAWSPDGGRIVFTGDTEITWQTDFFVYDVSTGQTRRVTTDLPCLPIGGLPGVQAPAQPVWVDDRRVLFHAVRAGASSLYIIDIDDGTLEELERAEALRAGMSVDRGHRYIVMGHMSLDAVGEIAVHDRETGETAVVTEYCRPTLAEHPPAQWERFDVTRDGFTTEAWLLKPPDFDATKRYPVVLDVHGGPNGYYGYGFTPMQQCLATNGFLVVYANPRGSGSYGRHFTLQVIEDWGGEDYLDLMAVVDRVLERPYADGDRVGIWGYSYGGYMTAWAIGQTDRFRAAVCGAPCFDLESMWGTSDISHVFGEVQWGGPPHASREWYATHSPSEFAHRAKTPTLIIHGEADERCPIGQGEQMFVALKKAGCEVEFARYPGGSHSFIRLGPPAHREDVLRRALAWFQRHLGQD